MEIGTHVIYICGIKKIPWEINQGIFSSGEGGIRTHVTLR